MKSSKNQLSQRGYLPNDHTLPKPVQQPETIIKLLNSPVATDRSIAARVISQNTGNFVHPLIESLRKEKKLYSKIEICNALVAQAPLSIEPLIEELGNIGTNQHKEIPEKAFEKDGYPLPRDIAARTLVRIGPPALPALQKALNTSSAKQLSEAIDAIGHICFYSPQPDIFKNLKLSFEKNQKNTLIKWKLIRAMSAFPESRNFLNQQLNHIENQILIPEIRRSIRLTNKDPHNQNL